MIYVYVGRNEITALIVGLIIGFIYAFLNLPIPAPPVLGGILAIIFTYIGYLIVQKLRGLVTFGFPSLPPLSSSSPTSSGKTSQK